MSGRRLPQRNALELARLRALRAARNRTEAALAMHVKTCIECARADKIVARYCDEGYDLACDKSKAYREWCRRDDGGTAPDAIAPLF